MSGDAATCQPLSRESTADYNPRMRSLATLPILLAACAAPGRSYPFPRVTETVRATLPTGERVLDAAITPDGSTAVVLGTDTFGDMQIDRAQVQGLAIDPKLDRLLDK